MLPTPCHSARSRRRSRRIHRHEKLKPSRRGGNVEDDGRGQVLINPRSSALPDFFFPKEKVFLWFLKSRFCNSGQALRAEWHKDKLWIWNSRYCSLIKALCAGWFGDEGWALIQLIQHLCKKPSCRMSWGWAKSGRRIRFIDVCHDGLNTKFPSCLMLNTWINPNLIDTSINNQQNQHHSKANTQTHL